MAATTNAVKLGMEIGTGLAEAKARGDVMALEIKMNDKIGAFVNQSNFDATKLETEVTKLVDNAVKSLNASQSRLADEVVGGVDDSIKLVQKSMDTVKESLKKVEGKVDDRLDLVESYVSEKIAVESALVNFELFNRGGWGTEGGGQDDVDLPYGPM